MRPRYLFITIISVTIFAAVLGLGAAGSLPHHTIAPTNTPPDPVAPMERVDVQIDAGTLHTAPTDLVPTRETLFQDSRAILEDHCTQCHTAQWLEQVEKSRSEWEKALAQMEAMGVRLEEPEKVALLDYLSAVDQP